MSWPLALLVLGSVALIAVSPHWMDRGVIASYSKAYAVAIQIQENNMSFHCRGIVLGPNTFLTSAKCCRRVSPNGVLSVNYELPPIEDFRWSLHSYDNPMCIFETSKDLQSTSRHSSINNKEDLEIHGQDTVFKTFRQRPNHHFEFERIRTRKIQKRDLTAWNMTRQTFEIFDDFDDFDDYDNIF